MSTSLGFRDMQEKITGQIHKMATIFTQPDIFVQLGQF